MTQSGSWRVILCVRSGKKGGLTEVRILVAFYSRTGNTRKVAEDISRVFREKFGDQVDMEEVQETKDRSGISGYTLAGRDAALKKLATLRPLKYHAADYDLVLIGGPVWAWTICPAVRTYCGREGINVSRLGFFCTMGGSGEKRAFAEMESLCGRVPSAVLGLKEKMIRESSGDYLDSLDEFCSRLREFT